MEERRKELREEGNGVAKEAGRERDRDRQTYTDRQTDSRIGAHTDTESKAENGWMEETKGDRRKELREEGKDRKSVV